MAHRKRASVGLTLLLLGVGALPVLAQQANFGSLHLAAGFNRAEASVSGHTGGSFSLDRLAPRDSRGNRCLGFGSPMPDHIMTLAEELGPLSLAVHSGGNDTMLVVQGPNQLVFCGDDRSGSKDAVVEAERWPAGTYQIWVGSLQPGDRWRYRLTAQ